MSESAKQNATYADILRLPENLVGEILNGRLVTHPRPAPRHARASSSLGDELVGPFDKGRGGPGGWWILDGPELHLGADIIVPDLAGWRRERLPDLPQTAWFELAPDWACEVLSPATALDDRVIKMPLYAAHGVEHVWLIDPDLKVLEVVQRQASQWLLIATLKENDAVSLPPFQAVEFSLAALWP